MDKLIQSHISQAGGPFGEITLKSKHLLRGIGCPSGICVPSLVLLWLFFFNVVVIFSSLSCPPAGSLINWQRYCAAFCCLSLFPLHHPDKLYHGVKNLPYKNVRCRRLLENESGL